MNERMNIGQVERVADCLWTKPEPTGDRIQMPGTLQSWKPLATAGSSARPMEEVMDDLVSAYLTSNLNFKRTPLKELMDDFERRVLHACLNLTQGHQRNAAAILGVKCTALFEKMRKHSINGRQMKLARRLGR